MTSDSEQSSHQTKYESYLMKAGLAVLAAMACLSITSMTFRAIWPYPIENFEGGILLAVRAWIHGSQLYPVNITQQPPIFNYPPFYALLIRLFYSDSDPFLPGRAISLLALICSSILLGLLVREGTKNRTLAFIASCVFLVMPENAAFGSLVRVDILSVTFSLACLYVGWRYKDSRYGIFISAALGVAAWFTKQTAILGPLSLFFWLLLIRDKRKAFVFGAMYGVILTVLISLVELMAHGVFLKNILDYSITSFSFETIIDYVKWYPFSHFPLHLLALIGVVFGFAAVLQKGWRSSPLFIYLIICIGSLASLGKEGASTLYLFEFHAACAINLGVGLSAIFEKTKRPIAVSVIVLLALMSLSGFNILANAAFYGNDSKTEQMAVDVIKSVADPILIEDPGYALLAGKTNLDLINPFLAAQLSARRLLDLNPIIQNIQLDKYKLIALTSPADKPSSLTLARFPQPMLLEMKQHYRFVGIVGEFYLYFPRNF